MWPSINPGDMRHRIIVLAPQAGEDASGAAVQYIETLRTYAAVVDDEKGREVNGSGIVAARETLSLRTWFDSRVKSDMRIQSDHGLWRIEQVINVRKMNFVMLLVCVAIEVDE